MRVFKLRKDWLLRGWSDEPWALLNWKNGDCRRLSEQMFQTACACDGRSDFDNITGFVQKNLYLDKLIKEGIAEECSMGDLPEPYQRYRKASNPYVRSVHWSITGRCNLKCLHCYMESPENRYGEPTLQEVLLIIGQLVEANVHQVELTGGEPFIRQDLFDILAVLAKKQIGLRRIYSNGLLITNEVLQGIKHLGFLPEIQISFDGCGTHDYMRGIMGIEQATIDAIRILRKNKFPVDITTSIDRNNIDSLDATYELMKELDIQYWQIVRPNKIGNWRKATTGLNIEELLPTCALITRRWFADGKPFKLLIPGYYSEAEEKAQGGFSPDNYDCMSCRITCSLLPDGTVIPCPSYTDTVVYNQMPNVFREHFASIWTKSSLRAIIDRKKRDILAANSQCSTCSEFERCGGGCRAFAVAETGNLLSVSSQFCEVHKKNLRQRFSEMINNRALS